MLHVKNGKNNLNLNLFAILLSSATTQTNINWNIWTDRYVHKNININIKGKTKLKMTVDNAQHVTDIAATINRIAIPGQIHQPLPQCLKYKLLHPHCAHILHHHCLFGMQHTAGSSL